MPSSRALCLRLPCLFLLLMLLWEPACGQWCHWLRWECEKSAILCRPVRRRACCSSAGASPADCVGVNSTETGAKEALYNSQSLMFDPPFECGTAFDSGLAACASQYAQYTPSANASLWCAWTYWTEWTMLADSAGLCQNRTRQRSRQRACECPPPTVRPSANVTSSTSGQCEAGNLDIIGDNSSSLFEVTVDSSGVLLMLNTELLYLASACADVENNTQQNVSADLRALPQTALQSGPSLAWIAAVAAAPLSLLLIAASVAAGIGISRLHASRTRADAAAVVANQLQFDGCKVADDYASAAVASSSASSSSPIIITLPELHADGTNAASATPVGEIFSSPPMPVRWPAAVGKPVSGRIFVESALRTRLAPLYPGRASPCGQLRITPIYSEADSVNATANSARVGWTTASGKYLTDAGFDAKCRQQPRPEI